jgi:hypothetical protein
MFESLLDWVDGDPSGLDKFVEILKIEPVKFRILIRKLDKSKFGCLSGGYMPRDACCKVLTSIALGK